MMSTLPAARSSSVSFCSAFVRKRLTMSMRTGKPAKRSLQRLLVLEREHRRRREERDLLAVHHRLERGAHRDFGLAVADVAAEQAVHRRRRLHVALDVGDRRLSDRGVRSYSNASSNSCCQCESALKAWPGTALRAA